MYIDDKNCYMVRAMFSRTEDFDLFFNNNIVAVGWREVDFTSFSDVNKLRNGVFEIYYRDSDKLQHFISKKLNEVERFKTI